MSRPSDYTPETADEICEHIASGKSLVSYCRIDGNPRYSTVMQWLAKHSEFAEKYARAREDQADYLADEILDVADDITIPPDHKRIMVDTRKWSAGKMKPKKYGDKIHQELTGPDGGKIEIETKGDTELNARILELAAKVGALGAAGAAGGKEE